MKFAFCNLGPIAMLLALCNYARLQSPTCTLHYVIKKSSKFWTIILYLLVVTSIPRVWILMNLLFNDHVLCYLVMIVD
jgi:carbon starvation protein CstA